MSTATHPTLSPEVWKRLSPAQREAVMAQARRRAQQLRVEAVHDLAAALLAAAGRAWRAMAHAARVPQPAAARA